MNDDLGERGEYYIGKLFNTRIKGRKWFKPHFLGAKAQLFDFAVNLTNDKGDEFGPFFFLQVKASGIDFLGASINADFSTEEVAKAQERKVPTYLVAVDVSDEETEVAFFTAVESNRKKGFAKVSRQHCLTSQSTRLDLWKEVSDFFDNKTHVFKSKFVRK